MSSSNLRHVIALLVIAALVGGGYYAVTAFNLTDGGVIRADEVRTQTDALQSGLFADIERVNAIKLDASVFSSPVYSSLVNYDMTLTSAPPSRPNPFAPL